MLGRAVQADPDDASAWLRLGQVQGDRGDYAAADRSLSRAIELAPENADAFFLRGAARMALGTPEDAERDARKALALSPGKEAFRRLLSALRGSGSRR
jgi:Flp pilus assembly protein TadD